MSTQHDMVLSATREVLEHPSPAAEVEPDDAFDGWQGAPAGSKVYLYTTNPRLTYGKRQALLSVVPAPLDLLELQRTLGGGPYYAILHDPQGQAVGSKRFALAGPPLLERRCAVEAPRPESPLAAWGQAPASAAPAAPSEVAQLRDLVRELASEVRELKSRPASPVQVLPPEDPLKAKVTELLLEQLGVRQGLFVLCSLV
jgi:hypothetical protein